MDWAGLGWAGLSKEKTEQDSSRLRWTAVLVEEAGHLVAEFMEENP